MQYRDEQIEAARARGWVVVPARVYKTKATATESGEWKQHPLEGWPNVTATPELEAWRPRDGVACVLEHSGLVDIDLDGDVARDLAPLFLRPTATFGRPGRERTHYIYSGGEGRLRQFTDPSGMLLELRRGHGTQTLMPGTRKGWSDEGPSATSMVVWSDAEPIAAWQAEDEGRVERLAVACYFALERDEVEGQRHASALAFAGILARAGWTLEHAELVVTAACEWRGDTGLHDRIASVRDTFAAHAAGQPVASWAALRDFMDHKRLGALGKILRCGRARIDLALKFDDIVDQSMEALANVPIGSCKVWRHGGKLVRSDLSGYATPALRVELSRAIDYIRTTKDGERVVHPPRDVTESIGDGDCSLLPEIVGLSKVPLLRRDGGVLQSRGYDPETKLWVDPIDVPVGHTREHAEAACLELLEGVRDVLWDDPNVDAIAWLAHVLTVAGRHLCTTVPVWIYDADEPGAGKTTVARAAGLIGGRCTDVFNPNFKDSIELARSLEQHAGQPAVVLDNLRGRIASPALEAALTSGVLKVRRLYLGNIDMALRAVVSMTGNDAHTGADWARRSLPVRLRKNGRQLDGSRELLEELDAPRYTAAALTMLRAWIREGKPSEATPLPSFRAWSQLIAGCVHWVTGVDLVGATRERAVELTRDENTDGVIDALADFLHSMQWEERGASASEICDAGASHASGGFDESPGAKLLAILSRGCRGPVTPAWVGRILGSVTEPDRRVAQKRRHGGVRSWYVETVTASLAVTASGDSEDQESRQLAASRTG